MSSAAPAPGHLEVARQQGAVLLRVVGLGNMNISLTLRDFVCASLKEGYEHFALDLKECAGMDSTFMGTLVAILTTVEEADGWLALLNVAPDNRKLMEMIGVWGLMPVREDYPVAAVETERLESKENPRERLELIHRAHEHLVAIDDRNRERFGRFLASLEEEMGPGDAAAHKAARLDPERIDRLRRFSRGCEENDNAPEA